MSEKLLTVRDVSQILNINEKEVVDLAQAGKIPAYNIGGLYLRFKKEQIDLIKPNFLKANQNQPAVYTTFQRARDFFYFNDFYILSVILIALLLVFIFIE